MNSDAIIADANCTKVCIYMSIVLLIMSGIYELTKLPYVDAVGSLGIGYFSLKKVKSVLRKQNRTKLFPDDNSKKLLKRAHIETRPIKIK